jgi:hypothetical protein
VDWLAGLLQCLFVSSKDRRKGGLSSLATFAALSDLTWLESFGVSVSLYLDSSMAVNWHGSDVCW